MHEPSQVMDPSNIKMVFDDQMNALYMSRTPIPFPFDAIDFGYNKMMLDFYRDSKPGTFERIEGIVTLRFLDYGKQLKLIEMDNLNILSVDTPKDLEEIKRIVKERGLEPHDKK